MKRYCFALDLKEDEYLISLYKEYHQKVWPEVIESIKSSGIISMEIFCAGNRLFMIMETADDFSFERKNKTDAANAKVQEWEELMERFQQRLSFASPDEKWVLLEKIFEL